MAATRIFWELMITLWTKSLIDGQSITIQPVSSEGDEGEPDSFTPLVFQVSSMDVHTQIVAIKRRGIVIADETVKRDSVFESLGLDADNYVITRQVVLPVDRQFSLRLTNPNRLDTAWFSFVVCGRNLTDAKCAESDIVLESDIAEFTVRYVPGDVYPNCSSLIKDGVSITRDGRLRVYLGETVVMLCQSEVGEPPVNLSWERDGHHVTSETLSDSVFRYSEVTFIPSLDDEGVVFACNLTRPLTNDLNRSCVVGSFDIVSEPTVTINYKNQNGFVIVGSTVVFTSFATTVTSTINRTFWTVSEELQNATDRYRIEENQFTLRDIEEADGGAIIKYVVIDNDGIQGVAVVTIQTINAGDLPTQPPNHDVVSTTRGTKACTTEPTPPADYSAVIIGSLFAALLVFIMVVMVCTWYYREVRNKKSSPAGLRVEEATKKPNDTVPSHKKPSQHQGVKVARDNDHYPPVRQRDLQTLREERNAGSPAREGNREPLEFMGIHREEKHPGRGDSPIKQGTSSRRDKYPYSNYVDDGPVDYGSHSHYKRCNEAHSIEPIQSRYQNIDDENVFNKLYDYNNDAYDGGDDDENTRYSQPDSDRYGIEPDTDNVSHNVFHDEERSFGRLTPSEMSDVGNDAQSQEHASTYNDWDDTLRYDQKEDEYEGVQSYV